ncbi:GntR family transcriptional regulator/MocR family aminotransferase [Bacillus sp. SLBN-46]|uniref:MocR-like pyridoxine biosynthesis transcription factor PdxR n=1 Tax=Bacillus sp. SLBN-46 TaxID=3042283 RepID=UPI002860F261|nr:PLP-dependent aminotransferase family protein [Bacillus sp. SLBN-46]MDR6125239.1 GntR family transcriptional regulator/MocR family aminotransferase [Bacillus sp. SLBN-46]
MIKVTELKSLIGTDGGLTVELTPFLHRELSEPLYSQLYHWIKKEIEEGRLLPGMKMPSIRQLTTHLKVSRNTVEAAYQQLQSEGYLESVPKSGIWVAEIEKPSLHPIDVVHPIMLECKPSSEVLVDFEYGNVDLDKFPLKQWKKCLSDAVDQENNWLFEYSEKQGEFALRREISNYLLQSRGVRSTPEQILITAGTQTSMALICRLLALQKKFVAMEEPGYSGVRSVFEDQGCYIEPVPLEKDGLSVEHIQTSRAKAVYLTPSHQFPFGMVLSISKRMRLLKWAYQTGGYIIEDDYDGEFRYRGQPIPSLKSLDEEEKVIYLGTFSKSFLPSVRLSYIVFPPSLMVQYSRKFADYNQSVSPIIQRAMALFMQSGEFERHIRRMRKLYQRKHQTLLRSIEQYMGTKVKIVGEKSGLHIILKLKDVSTFELIENGLQKGVKVYSPLRFWLKPTPEGNSYIMLGFGGLSIEEIEKGVRLLASCLP